MSEHSQDTRQSTGIKLDMQINLPTILTVIGMFAGSVTYINNQFNALNNSQLITAGDVKVLQSKVGAQEVGLASTRADMISSRNENASQINMLRTELRGDLRDLKESVDRINNPANRGR